jgi:lactoylglutathione lyase
MSPTLAQNLSQVVPFFQVRDMAKALAFYVDGLGFEVTLKWTPDAPDRIRWCRLEAGRAALMLQELYPTSALTEPRGVGVSVSFFCSDALAIYRAAIAKGLAPQKPFVGNELWVVSFSDPDGFKIDFTSPTDVAEDTEYDLVAHG